MADNREIVLIEIGRLFEFIDDLQTSGYKIDPRQIAALNHLLVLLVARGESLDELPLKIMMAPLVCSTQLEQEDFYQRFDHWQATLLPIKQVDTEENLPIVPPSQDTLEELLPPLDPTVAAQDSAYISREATKQETNYTKVLVKGYVQEILPVRQIKPIVSALRKRTQVPSTDVDVERTIEHAIKNNNWLEVVYRQRQLLPEYVVLIDRKNRLDLQARFVQEVLAKFSADGVWLHQYEFKGDPRICFPIDKKNTPLRLKDLQARHPESRLLVFSGTNELTNPLTGKLQEWVENLEYWKERAILTPDNLGMVLQEGLKDQDFAILPLTFDGLASIVRVFESENILLPFSDSNLPTSLTARPTRWTGRSAPPEEEVKALVMELKDNYLDRNGFYWLCATAVYPELRWELTLHLGSVLKDNAEKPLLDTNNLIRLARLPWFRLGYMPDWIRLPFIESLLPEQEMQVREVISNLLSSSQEGPGFELSIARITNGELQKQVSQDHVLIKFLASSENKKIDFIVPSSLQDILNENQPKTDHRDFSTSIPKSSQEQIFTDKDSSADEKALNTTNVAVSQNDYGNFLFMKPRVLIVDNDPSSRVSYQALIMDFGYEPVLAMGRGEELINNARKLSRDKRCAIALIDLRLLDDNDENDMSGADFAESMRTFLSPIILTGVEDLAVLRNLLQNHQNIPFIGMQDRRDLFKKILDQEAAKVTAAKRELVFENVELLEEISLPLKQFTGEFTDQIKDVFAKLFPSAKKIRLEKIESNSQLSTKSRASRPASVIVKAYEDDLEEPCVVKISSAARIQREVENYNKYIARKLTASFFQGLGRSSVLWDIGAIAYSSMGEFDTKTFSQFYEERSITDIEDCLTSFFHGLWNGNYKQARVVNDVSLFELYSSVWGNWGERIKSISDPDSSYLVSVYDQMNLPRPIEWIKNNVTEAPVDVSIIHKTWTAITHGDLHGDNLLVDNKNNPWLISFERCGEGHVLQDFIELEADIINRLEVSDDKLPAYIKMLVTVLEQKKLQGFDISRTSPEYRQFEKALQTISILRSLASTCTEVIDTREYLLGLLFNVILRVSIQGVNSPKSQSALLFASLICHRLDHWNKPWSLSGAKPYQDLNFANESNKVNKKESEDKNRNINAHNIKQSNKIKFRPFICYSKLNRSAVRGFFDLLQREKWINPWFDEKDILPGQVWENTIQKGIKESHVALIFLSKGILDASGFIHNEIQLILENFSQRPSGTYEIVPIRLDACEIPEYLKKFQWIDYFGGQEKKSQVYSRLVEALKVHADRLGISTGVLEQENGKRVNNKPQENSNITIESLANANGIRETLLRNTGEETASDFVYAQTHASAPGKIILFGEHAVVYNRPALAVPVIQVHADVRVSISSRPGIWIHATSVGLDAELSSLPTDHPIASVVLNTFSSLNISLPSALDISISSTIPVSAGLGSGASVSIALIRALSSFYSRRFSDDEVNLLAFEIEKIHHGTPSGIDNTVISFKKPTYFIKGKPIEIFSVKKPFVIVIGDTGIPAPTKETVGDVRRLWLRDSNKFENIFNEIGQITQMARRFIETGETKLLGELMNQNHALLQQLTVSSPELDILVNVAREAGALGAKLSGGGRGGNMIALASPKDAKKIASALIKAGAKNTIVSKIK